MISPGIPDHSPAKSSGIPGTDTGRQQVLLTLFFRGGRARPLTSPARHHYIPIERIRTFRQQTDTLNDPVLPGREWANPLHLRLPCNLHLYPRDYIFINQDVFSPDGDLDRRNMTPTAIAISPARMNTIFNITTVKAMRNAHATNNNPKISTQNPSQTLTDPTEHKNVITKNNRVIISSRRS
jgi:hypothetical protein